MSPHRNRKELERLIRSAKVDHELPEGLVDRVGSAIEVAPETDRSRRIRNTWSRRLVYGGALVVMLAVVAVCVLRLPSKTGPVAPRKTSVARGQPERTYLPGAVKQPTRSPAVASDISTRTPVAHGVGSKLAAAVASPTISPEMLPGQPFVAVIAARQPATDAAGRALRVGDRLGIGIVRTGKQGRLTLITRRGSEFTLNQNTELALKSRDLANLRRGEIYCRSRKHEIARVDTSAGAIHLLGTAIDAATENSHKVAVTVLAGKVRLSNAHGEAIVAAGKRTVMVASLAPGEGDTVNTFAATAWYDSRGEVVSEFGDIAYLVQRGGGLLTEVWKMKADGSAKQRVKTYIHGGGTSWVPWGRVLLIRTWGVEWRQPDFATRQAYPADFPQQPGGGFPIVDDQTWLLDAVSGQDMALPPLAGYRTMRVSISPDGEHLAFAGAYNPAPFNPANLDFGVWIYDLRSGDVRKVLDQPYGDEVAWAPDSRRLAATVYRHSHLGLVMIDSVTGEVTALNLEGQGAAFSPDGSKLAYYVYVQEAALPSQSAVTPGTYELFVTDSAPGGTTCSIATTAPMLPRFLWPLLWSPDGTRVAYTGDTGIFVAQADGSGAKQVYEGPANARHIAWAPSGDGLYLWTGEDTLLVAADGSGVIANLGGNETDSELTAAERAQVAGASEAIREAVFEYAVGHVRYYEGRAAEAEAAFTASADIFAGLMWRYPEAGLSAGEVLLYADKAMAMATGQLKPDERTRLRVMDDPGSHSYRNLAQLALGIIMWAADHDNTLPDLTDQSTIPETLAPWVKGSSELFINPVTHKPYMANAALSGKAFKSVADPTTVVVLYEDSPAPDGSRGVAFLDGVVRRVSQSEWEAIAKASNLP